MRLHERDIIIDEKHIEKITMRIGPNYEDKIRDMLKRGKFVPNKAQKAGEKLCIAKDEKGKWYKIPFTSSLKSSVIVISVIPITKKEAKRLKNPKR